MPTAAPESSFTRKPPCSLPPTLNLTAPRVVYSLERSRSQRILWLLEELNLTYEIRPYKRGVNERAPPELKSIHPIGKAPILSIYPKGNGNNNGQSTVRSSGGNTDSDRSPCTLAESAVIMEHLLEHFHRPQEKRLTPIRWVDGQENQVGGETDAWLRYRYYMHYTEGSLMPLVVTNILMDGSSLSNSVSYPSLLPGIANILVKWLNLRRPSS